MAVIGDLLFYNSNGPDLDDVLRHQVREGFSKIVDAVPEGDFARLTDEELVERVSQQATLQPLTVEFDRAEPRVVPTTVQVHDYGRVLSVKGFRITKSIPFSGDAGLWRLKPNPWDLNPPRGEVGRGQVTIGFELPESEAERANGELERTIARIREYLDRQAAQIAQHNSGIRMQIMPIVQQRRAYLNKGAALLESLKKA